MPKQHAMSPTKPVPILEEMIPSSSDAIDLGWRSKYESAYLERLFFF